MYKNMTSMMWKERIKKKKRKKVTVNDNERTS